MRNSLIWMLIILVTGCKTTDHNPQNKSENIPVPVPFQAAANQLSYNSYIAECVESCNAKLMLDIREYSDSFNFSPFAAFAIQDEQQEFSVRVQVEYSPNTELFEYSLVTRHNGSVLDKKIISEHRLPDIFQFSVLWTNDSFSVIPHVKEVADKWFRFVPSKEPIKVDLNFKPHSYAYLASGSKGRFILFSGEQNILNLNKKPVNVKPIQKNLL